jgi:hypothetical protein
MKQATQRQPGSTFLSFVLRVGVAVGLTLFAPLAGQAWDQHQTFTGLVVQEMKDKLPVLAIPVKPTGLATFLRRQEKGLKPLLAGFFTWKAHVYPHRQWLISTANREFLFNGGPGSLTVERFKDLLGVQKTAFDTIVVSPEFAESFGLAKIGIKTTLPFGTWLALFSDEPDWGMDIGLFGKGDPRYTEIPYGDIDKLSSQAPFHMYFANENLITYKSRASLRQSMTLLRFSIFQRLAAFALAKGEWFWGARFLGCALHYLQDVAMPYHASALPYATVFTYLKYAVVKDKDKFLNDNMQLVANRHFAYEAFGLKFMQLLEGKVRHALPAFDLILDRAMLAAKNPTEKSNEEFLADILNRVAKASYKHARNLDKIIGKTFAKRLVKDPTFDPKTNEEFLIDTWFNEPLFDDYVAGRTIPQKALFSAYVFDLVRTVECTTLLVTNLLHR